MPPLAPLDPPVNSLSNGRLCSNVSLLFSEKCIFGVILIQHPDLVLSKVVRQIESATIDWRMHTTNLVMLSPKFLCTFAILIWEQAWIKLIVNYRSKFFFDNLSYSNYWKYLKKWFEKLRIYSLYFWQENLKLDYHNS